MNRGQILSLVVFVGLTIGMVAYVQKQSKYIEGMDYELGNFKISGWGQTNLTFTFDLTLDNQSNFDLKVSKVDFKVFWNNMQVGAVVSNQKYLVPKRTRKAIPLILSLDRTELSSALQDAFSSPQEFLSGVVAIKGTMDVGADFIDIRDYPFEYTDTAANLVGYSLNSVLSPQQ